MDAYLNLYKQWADAFASIDGSHISTDTASKILAVVCVYGGSCEAFTHTPKLSIDINAAKRMFNIEGGEEPTLDGVRLIRKYVRELEEDIKKYPVGEEESAMFSKVCHVKWANKLFKERYGFEKLLL